MVFKSLYLFFSSETNGREKSPISSADNTNNNNNNNVDIDDESNDDNSLADTDDSGGHQGDAEHTKSGQEMSPDSSPDGASENGATDSSC